MIFDLDQRTAALSVGEFAGFALGPREAGDGGAAGLWRAQLGTHWHQELRTRTAALEPAAEFEVAITGRIVHRGWTLTLTGRIDQLIRSGAALTLREIKTVTRSLPADEAELRAEHPDYFIQLACYGALARLGALTLAAPPAPGALRTELVFVETGSGLAQTILLTTADEGIFRAQLERCVEFLALRHRARERLRGLRYRPAFATPRPGQETTQAELTALFERHPHVLFEAPTGFGKTGTLLEFALGQLRSGHFDRALYLTSKSTGQLQVVRTLAGMTGLTRPVEAATAARKEEGARIKGTPAGAELPSAPEPNAFHPAPYTAPAATTAVAAWHVRNKAEHCVNTTFHCVRDRCLYLDGAAARWAQSGLARFYLDEHHARDLDTLRAAGRDARICPYEITRTALAFNDVWIGDYNYVFAPRNRGLFYDQPGFVPARTLLIVDEAHNLPARVADAYSHAFSAAAADAIRDELHRVRPLAALVTAWDHWCHFLRQLRANGGLSAADEDDAQHLLGEVAKHLRTTPLDFGELGPYVAEVLWSVPALVDEFALITLPRLWWSPHDGELELTCLDAASVIGATLREFGGVVLASATLTPVDGFTAACGLDGGPEGGTDAPSRTGPSKVSPAQGESLAPRPEKLGALSKRDTKKLFRQLTSAAALLRVEEAREAAQPMLLRAQAPWREGAYDLLFDARVDTTFQHRSHHYATTAAAIAALHGAATVAARGGPGGSCVAVFFPSYAYAEAIAGELARLAPGVRAALQPRKRDLAAQTSWVEESLLVAEALFLVLGSSFAESIDSLGGRVTHALVVGPALPEVNAVQRARLAEAARMGAARDAAFRRVYQIPGMTKVNQALGRLVRAPGQHARVILHCRRFLEPSYASLLEPEYQRGTNAHDDNAFTAWLAR
ncbi:MAG: PD-(D/E)XK nuclease family protein [Opitutaceae bacterium]|nr:PD-(D/E)XK nuclease family protein [Opitutaceae bacterium]